MACPGYTKPWVQSPASHKLGMVAQVCNSSIRGMGKEDWGLEVILGYTTSSREAWATWDPVSKQQLQWSTFSSEARMAHANLLAEGQAAPTGWVQGREPHPLPQHLETQHDGKLPHLAEMCFLGASPRCFVAEADSSALAMLVHSCGHAAPPTPTCPHLPLLPSSPQAAFCPLLASAWQREGSPQSKAEIGSSSVYHAGTLGFRV